MRCKEQTMKKYDLSGEWRFSLNTPELTDTIQLPGTTAQARKGAKNHKRETGFLTERYPFEGRAYYEKTIMLDSEDVGKPMELFLERTRMTRVWVNGVPAGSRDSLSTPHVYKLTERVISQKLTIRIEVANTGYPTPGGHLTSPDTQTNWNGITGELYLAVFDAVSIRFVRAEADYHGKKVHLDLEVVNSGRPCTRTVHIRPYEKMVEGIAQRAFREEQFALSLPSGRSTQQVVYCFIEEPVCWSEYTPVVYRFACSLSDSEETAYVETGLQEFKAAGNYFYINGHRILLRGKHDGMIFPLTGAAPTQVSEWLRVMRIAKDYGINHYRFHTCCPPEAAFEAADLLGIYMEPELPFWGTVTEAGEEGHNETQQEYLIEEGFRMMRAFGNHPSFCMMSLGNELWGSHDRITEILTGFKRADRRHLYTQGSNNFQFVPWVCPEEDFFVGVRLAGADEQGRNDRLIRGSFAMCDAPLGHVQAKEPGTAHCYDDAVFPKNGEWKPRLPVVQHEIGQYGMYPDYREIEKYRGVLCAENLRIFRERLEEKGMGAQAEAFFFNSGMLAVQCYQEELEAAHRSASLAGYQILDIQDFTGQGTALVGILNAFMESKGLISPEAWRSFCSDCVLLASFERYCLSGGETLEFAPLLSYFRFAQPLKGRTLRWQLYRTAEEASLPLRTVPSAAVPEAAVIAQGTAAVPDGAYGLIKLGKETVGLPETDMPVSLRLRLALEDKAGAHDGTVKEYPFWLYPRNEAFVLREGEITDASGQRRGLVTRDYEAAREYLKKGGRVLWFSEKNETGIPGAYCTDFWNYPMFRKISEDNRKPLPTGTMGLLIRKEHPALRAFPSETYTTPQWYPIIENSDCVIPEDVSSAKLRPIVQVIDNVERNHKLGILFEAEQEGGTLLVCTSRLFDRQDLPQVRQYAKSLCEYLVLREKATDL
ncbi:MAG: beta-glucuronidase [Roseburia sp.]|nr:beta-glucuronidase [Roseburia sp.]